MKVLWLTSWYPNTINPTNGDFIQRQAKAVAQYCRVDVIHVEKDDNNISQQPVGISKNTDGNLCETIVIYPTRKAWQRNRFFSLLRYKKLFKKEIRKYMDENGLPDLIHVHVAMKAGMMALWLKKKFNVPYIISEHWTMYNSDAPDRYENRNIFFKKMTQKIFKNASLLISVSEDLAATISKKIGPTPYTIAYNVVDTRYFFYKEKISSGSFTFIHVSTCKEQKNPEAIIDAFIAFHQQIPASRLWMVGEAPKKLHQYYQQKNLAPGIIDFKGFIPYEDLGNVVQSADAFVLFSKRENMPCVVLEALCCGLPVITSRAGGVAEVIDKRNGIVVHDYNTAALATAMMQLYKNYESYHPKAIAAKARSMFGYEIIGARIAAVYRQVAGSC